MLVGRYNCVSESNTDRDKDTIHVEIQNNMVPVGADYIHVQDYSTSMAGNIAPSMVSASPIDQTFNDNKSLSNDVNWFCIEGNFKPRHALMRVQSGEVNACLTFYRRTMELTIF